MTWPTGVRSAAAASGVKRSGKLDLGVLVGDASLSWAGTFTRNAAAAPCVRWCRELLGGPVRAVVVNSGNANACTGEGGMDAVERAAAGVAGSLGCSPREVLVASTGIIGVPLPVDRILAAVPRALTSLTSDPKPFSRSILTTDTTNKLASARAGAATVVGVAKGSAMLAPNMATMLAFLVTDAEAGSERLQTRLNEAVQRSFDRISVDACESTNDSVFLLGTGAAGPVPDGALAEAIETVCRDLAEQMVRDAEGGSKIIRIKVVGARDDERAVSMGKAVAASALWRAAAHGSEPNWGRVVAALGSADRTLDLAAVAIGLGSETVFADGEPTGIDEAVRKTMDSDEIVVTCILGQGHAEAEVLSADLSPDYVELNAFATT